MTTSKDLENLVNILNNRTGMKMYELDHMAGGYRLETKGGSQAISPRLPAGKIALWLSAFLDGWGAALASVTCPDCEATNTHLPGCKHA